MEILKTVRTLNLPDWYIAAGIIRNTVWDYLHHYKKRTSLNDIDVVYFNNWNLNKNKDKEIENQLKQLNSKLNWEVVNQARAHLFNERRKAFSSCDSISMWTETPTCIGVRLENNNKLTICAHHGFTDLMELKVHSNTNPRLYKQRMKEKQWQKSWPKLKIYDL